MDPVISLIIPVYNVEKYLDKCIQSVLAQTYDNFEVILVDDGSTDNSGKMCDEYAEKDGRVRAFHQVNSGVCHARNVGINSARGEFISFIDADDFIDEKYLEILVNAQMEKNYDFTLCEFTNLDEKTGISARKVSYENSCEFFDDDIKRYVTPRTLVNPKKQMIGNPYCKLFRRRIIADNKIKYCEEIHLHEDRMFNYEYCQHIKSFVYIPKSLYTRLVRRDSAMNIFREDTLSEYQKICKEFMRLLNKYSDFDFSEKMYCEIITVSDVLPRYVCNRMNKKKHRTRWNEYYNFLNSRYSGDVWNRINKLNNIPFKYSMIIFLIKLHMTYLITWMYTVHEKIKR